MYGCSVVVTGKITQRIIEKLEIVITKTVICWRNLRLSTKMVKIHGIKEYLLHQIKNTMELDASLNILLNKHINLVSLMKK